jgi:hypothetical protein
MDNPGMEVELFQTLQGFPSARDPRPSRQFQCPNSVKQQKMRRVESPFIPDEDRVIVRGPEHFMVEEETMQYGLGDREEISLKMDKSYDNNSVRRFVKENSYDDDANHEQSLLEWSSGDSSIVLQTPSNSVRRNASWNPEHDDANHCNRGTVLKARNILHGHGSVRINKGQESMSSRPGEEHGDSSRPRYMEFANKAINAAGCVPSKRIFAESQADAPRTLPVLKGEGTKLDFDEIFTPEDKNRTFLRFSNRSDRHEPDIESSKINVFNEALHQSDSPQRRGFEKPINFKEAPNLNNPIKHDIDCQTSPTKSFDVECQCEIITAPKAEKEIHISNNLGCITVGVDIAKTSSSTHNNAQTQKQLEPDTNESNKMEAKTINEENGSGDEAEFCFAKLRNCQNAFGPAERFEGLVATQSVLSTPKLNKVLISQYTSRDEIASDEKESDVNCNKNVILHDIKISPNAGECGLLRPSIQRSGNDMEAETFSPKIVSKASNIGFLLNEVLMRTPPPSAVKQPIMMLSPASKDSNSQMIHQPSALAAQEQESKTKSVKASQLVVSDEMLDICISHIASEMASRICKRVESTFPRHTLESVSAPFNQQEHDRIDCGEFSQHPSMDTNKDSGEVIDSSPAVQKERLISLQALCSSPRLNLAEQFDQNAIISSDDFEVMN